MRVSKAHACGNDFLIVDDAAARGRDYAGLARTLCARTTSVGADGVEFLTWVGDRAGRIRLHNADGSIAEISGNGTRCVAAWMAYEHGLATGDTILLETDAGPRQCGIEERESAHFLIRSGMGIPTVERRRLVLADGSSVEGAVVSTGNPHFVIFTDADFAVAGRSWEEIGSQICFHPDFPNQTNVEFVRILTPGHIEIRIFERGVGPTSSSGTGSSAAAAAAIALGHASNSIRVRAPGGEQMVKWNGGGTGELQLTGPAQIIMTGDVFLAGETIR
ncbi:MAG: diaminopimelate epimerase [Acidobacteriaceae bacterium]